MRLTRVTVGYLESIGEPGDSTEWVLRVTMPGKFRLLQAGLQGFDGPISMLSCFGYGKKKSTYKTVGERTDDETFLATVAVMVDSDDVTWLK